MISEDLLNIQVGAVSSMSQILVKTLYLELLHVITCVYSLEYK